MVTLFLKLVQINISSAKFVSTSCYCGNKGTVTSGTQKAQRRFLSRDSHPHTHSRLLKVYEALITTLLRGQRGHPSPPSLPIIYHHHPLNSSICGSSPSLTGHTRKTFKKLSSIVQHNKAVFLYFKN